MWGGAGCRWPTWPRKPSTGGSAERDFCEGKLAAAAFYFARLLPPAEARGAALEAGAAAVPAVVKENLLA